MICPVCKRIFYYCTCQVQAMARVFQPTRDIPPQRSFEEFLADASREPRRKRSTFRSLVRKELKRIGR